MIFAGACRRSVSLILEVVMVICAVLGCMNRSGKDKNKCFFRLPSVVTHQGERTLELSKRRQVEWLAKIRRQDIRPEKYANTRVCSDHFISGTPAALYDESNPDWAPSLHLGHDAELTTDGIDAASSRYTRMLHRSRKRTFSKVAQDDDDDDPVVEEPEADGECDRYSISTQTYLSMEDIHAADECARQQDEIDQLRSSLEATKEECRMLTLTSAILQQEIKATLIVADYFKDNNEKVLYYTGLNTWELLDNLFRYVEPFLKQHSVLTPFQQLVATLMRLRLNLNGKDLAYRLKVHESTISRTFEFVICLLYAKLKSLILWPNRDALKKTMPMVFRKHCPSCVVIIDCFEIFVDRPTNLLARAQTYSQYKHHNTVKYLIGITPQGTVSYISEGWGGRTSDKFITEHSSLLSNLVPGDTILADRGFDITDSVGFYCATVKTPAFTLGRNQLTGIEVEQTRRIANIRIHVERVIGNIRKKYSILSATQPIQFLMSSDESRCLLDKIVHVCCALINMCDSVVPFD